MLYTIDLVPARAQLPPAGFTNSVGHPVMRGTRSGAGFQYNQSEPMNALKLPVDFGIVMKEVILGKIKCRTSSDSCSERQHVNMMYIYIAL